MKSETIKQLDEMQQNVALHLQQSASRWESLIEAYELSWRAIELYTHMPLQERLENVDRIYFFYEKIGEIQASFLNIEEKIGTLVSQCVADIDLYKEELAAVQRKVGQEIIKLGDAKTFTAIRLMNATNSMEELQTRAKPVLAFVRVMCDISALGGVMEEGYLQYNRLYNKLAQFLNEPYRGYDEKQRISMDLSELEYVEAQIRVREKTERMAPFVLVYLEMVRKDINARIEEMKKLDEEEASSSD